MQCIHFMEMIFYVDHIGLSAITAGVLIYLESVIVVQTALMELMNMIAHRLKVVTSASHLFCVALLYEHYIYA